MADGSPLPGLEFNSGLANIIRVSASQSGGFKRLRRKVSAYRHDVFDSIVWTPRARVELIVTQTMTLSLVILIVHGHRYETASLGRVSNGNNPGYVQVHAISVLVVAGIVRGTIFSHCDSEREQSDKSDCDGFHMRSLIIGGSY